ncbi:MAG: acyl carrier protein [Muribaculaceae bacterium]|nr:acyl carrier protein [Muribaculaceae bacterium]
MSEIADRVKAIIVETLSVDEGSVKDNVTFSELGADSLDTVDIIMNFEKEFDVKISDDDAQKIATVGDAIAFVENAEKAKNA